MTKTQSEWTGSAKQLMPFWSRQRRSRGPFQQNTRGEMIPKAGNHSFNYIFFLLSPSLSLPLLGCSLRPDVCHFATLLTASPFLHCVWSNGNCSVFYSARLLFPRVFAFVSQASFFHLCVSVGASTAVLEGVRVFSNGRLCCADSHNL